MSDRGEVIGTWDDVFAGAPASVRATAEAARAAILVADPATVETARPGDRAVTFGVGPRKMKDGYAYLMPQRDRVNLGFYDGASLPDPAGLLEGTGKALRHVKLRTVAAARSGEVAALIAAAAARRRERVA